MSIRLAIRTVMAEAGFWSLIQAPRTTTNGFMLSLPAVDRNSLEGNTMPKMDDIPKPRDPRVDRLLTQVRDNELARLARLADPPLETPRATEIQDQRHPPRGIPNGRVVVTSIHGTPHEYPFSEMPRGWRQYNRYLAISTPTGWVNWAWGAIMNWEIIGRKSDSMEKAADGDADGS